MTSDHTYFVVSDDNEPIGIFNLDQVETEATRYAHALAAASDDPAALDRINAETLARVGVDSIGYVCASALRIVVEHILSPVLDVAAAHGTDLREGLRAIADGRDPQTGEPTR
ncbi:hypothetical protein [Jiangella mangrovi]|uniref:Uncharacterized protein n=1 Tax=Jiangella mangrovi TaxID=1524084 RepID=A0A7W9GLD5_9ACTN|nr:hypothetical protein [Jiangella mangrovi]MBB5785988.1 hypothetical protein [Jiangella mangrovi]